MTKAKKSNNSDVIFNPAAFLENIGLEGFSGPDDSELWSDQFPYIQWNNSLKCWEFPLKHWAGTEIETSQEMTEVDHGEETEFSFLLPEINIAVINWRFTWECLGDDGRMVYSSQPSFGSGQKWSKRYNFMCLVKEAGSDDPAIITAKGFTGEFLYNALNQSRKRTLKLARKLTGKQFPGYLFWVPLAAGDKRMVGTEKKSPIYPPSSVAYDVAEIDNEGIGNLLAALYIGDEYKNVIANQLYAEGEKWRADTPQRAALTSGQEEAKVTILPDQSLYFPDLSQASKPVMIDMAMTIPGLFNVREHAANAFAKVLRSKRLATASTPDQWEAWRLDLEQRWDEMNKDETLQVEAYLNSGG